MKKSIVMLFLAILMIIPAVLMLVAIGTSVDTGIELESGAAVYLDETMPAKGNPFCLIKKHNGNEEGEMNHDMNEGIGLPLSGIVSIDLGTAIADACNLCYDTLETGWRAKTTGQIRNYYTEFDGCELIE